MSATNERNMNESIEICIKRAKKEMVDAIKSRVKQFREKVQLIESCRLAACLLAGEGFKPYISYYSPESMTIELENEKDLIKVRKALGVRLKATGNKETIGKKRNYVWAYVEAEGFPGLSIKYKRRISPKDPCKIVRKRYSYSSRAVVCQMS